METEQPTSRPTTGNPHSNERPGVRERVRRGLHSQVGTRKDRAVDQLMSVADVVRRVSEPLQGQPYDTVVKYVNNAAERVEQAALYLREHDFNELVGGLREVARRRPTVFVGVGLLAGAMCGRLLKTSNGATTLRPADHSARRGTRMARSVQERVGRMVRERPLLTGAAAVGLGLAVGMRLPRTEREDRLLGNTRDLVLDRAKEVARAPFEAAKGVVDSVRQLTERST